ncbi:MAG: zinc ABC transporter substrate-binding protein, partial [Candidatus Omnitrophota bacterium]|nr:zinc ABC transporter substrate-binding protein [Candidatus Omnitrophota bacterium]
DKVASINKGLTIIDNSAGITMVDSEDEEGGHLPGTGHYHGPKDPHIWLSPKNAVIMIGGIKDALIGRDPDHADVYRKNAEVYINELNNLDREIREKLKDKKKRVFMVFHPAWVYFARDYGLKEIAIESEGKEPTIAGLRGIIDMARENGIKVIFISPQFSRRSAEVVAKETGCKIVAVDDLSKDYTGNMRRVAGVLKEGID